MRNLKTLVTLAFIILLNAAAHAQSAKIDESNLVAKLLSIGASTPEQADSYYTGKKYALASKSQRNLGVATGEFSKYKMSDSTDSYAIMTVKGKIINSMYITYTKPVYLKALDDAAKMGFKQSEAATPDPTQTVYSRGDERFIVRITTANEKIFYTLATTNLVVTNKAIAEAKGQ